MNVLVVDDEHAARERLSLMVDNFPDCHVVGKAHDGIESVYMADSMAVDLVLMDIRMPRMSGIEAAPSHQQHRKAPSHYFHHRFCRTRSGCFSCPRRELPAQAGTSRISATNLGTHSEERSQPDPGT